MPGTYGITGPNKKIPRRHVFLIVKRGKKKSEIMKEIRRHFKCDPKKYFELRRECKRKPTFRYMSGPTSGGSIVVVNRSSGPNPLRSANDGDDEESDTSKASGTLTMFCCQNGKHYALTCFHVVCVTDELPFGQAFNHVQQDIRKWFNTYENYAKKQEYHYREKNMEHADEISKSPVACSANDTPLGRFSQYCFDSESDMMSIQVHEDIQVDCTVEDIENPDWDKIWEELFQRVCCSTGDRVIVQKVGSLPSDDNIGYIAGLNVSYALNGDFLFEDAIVIEGMAGSFMKDGDCGALVYFLDSNQVKQAFAYVIGEIDYPDSSQGMTMNNDSSAGESSSNETDVGSEEVKFYSKEPMSTEEKVCDDSSASVSGRSEEGGVEVVFSPEKPINSDNDESSDDESSDDESSDDKSIFFSAGGPFCICLRLDIALEKLGLLDKGCFKKCGSTR